MFASKSLANGHSLTGAGTTPSAAHVCECFLAADQLLLDSRRIYSDTGKVRRRRVSLFDTAPVPQRLARICSEGRRQSASDTPKIISATSRTPASSIRAKEAVASAVVSAVVSAGASAVVSAGASSAVDPPSPPVVPLARLPPSRATVATLIDKPDMASPLATEAIAVEGVPEFPAGGYSVQRESLSGKQGTQSGSADETVGGSAADLPQSDRLTGSGRFHRDSRDSCITISVETALTTGKQQQVALLLPSIDTRETDLRAQLPNGITHPYSSSSSTSPVASLCGSSTNHSDQSVIGESTNISVDLVNHPLQFLRAESSQSAPPPTDLQLPAAELCRLPFDCQPTKPLVAALSQRRCSESHLGCPRPWSETSPDLMSPVSNFTGRSPWLSTEDGFGASMSQLLTGTELQRLPNAARPRLLQLLPPSRFSCDISSRNLSSDASGQFELASSTAADFSPLSNIETSEESPGGSLGSTSPCAPPINYVRQRRTAVSSESVSARGLQNWTPPFFPKTSEEESRILRVLQDRLVSIFGPLPNQHLIVYAMQKKYVQLGTVLIRQGDEGDFFYVVDSGRFEIFVKRGDAMPQKVLDVSSGGSFGELALMYLAPRAATCTAVEDSVVWALDRISFRMLVVTAENTRRKEYESFLENIDIFKCLTKFEIARLSDILVLREYTAGECVIRQGTVGEHFFIVESGTLVCKMARETSQMEIEVHQYTRGGYFGELALIMTCGIRKASVYAVEKARLLAIDKPTFDRVLGPVVELLQKNAGDYPTYAEILLRHQREQKRLGSSPPSRR